VTLKNNLAEQYSYIGEGKWILKSSLIIVTESETTLLELVGKEF